MGLVDEDSYVLPTDHEIINDVSSFPDILEFFSKLNILVKEFDPISLLPGADAQAMRAAAGLAYNNPINFNNFGNLGVNNGFGGGLAANDNLRPSFQNHYQNNFASTTNHFGNNNNNLYGGAGIGANYQQPLWTEHTQLKYQTGFTQDYSYKPPAKFHDQQKETDRLFAPIKSFSTPYQEPESLKFPKYDFDLLKNDLLKGLKFDSLDLNKPTHEEFKRDISSLESNINRMTNFGSERGLDNLESDISSLRSKYPVKSLEFSHLESKIRDARERLDREVKEEKDRPRYYSANAEDFRIKEEELERSYTSDPDGIGAVMFYKVTHGFHQTVEVRYIPTYKLESNERRKPAAAGGGGDDGDGGD